MDIQQMSTYIKFIGDHFCTKGNGQIIVSNIHKKYKLYEGKFNLRKHIEGLHFSDKMATG